MSATKSKSRDYTATIMRVGGRMLRIAVWKGQSERARPLLFFNGIGANVEAMSPLADWFADRDVVTFDMPGIGKSPKPVFPYNPWTMAWRTARLLDKLGYRSVDVMGVSWGGGMAQQFAFQYPSRVGKLVLVATSPGALMVPGDVGALAKMAGPRRYLDPEFLRRNFTKLYGGDGVGADAHAARLTPPSRRGYLYQLGAMLGWTSLYYLPFLRQKTLVLMGDADKIVPLVNGRILATLIPKARMEVVRGGGHLFLVSRADEAAPLIQSFLREAD